MLLPDSEEHAELRSSVRRFFNAVSTESVVRSEVERPDGAVTPSWSRATAELGLAALAVPEAYGGMGYGFGELAIVLEEAGRSLWPAPLLSTAVLASTALLLAGDDDASTRWLSAIADGRLVATFAHQEDRQDWQGSILRTRAIRSGDRWLLTGHKELVVDGAIADLVLVTASTPQGSSLFALEPAPGSARTSLSTMDQTRRLAALDLHDVPAEPVGSFGGAPRIVAGVLDRAAVALALESIGAAQRLLDLAVSYAGDRVQFGRRIGSFQAVKHALVDVHVDLELARSVAWSAAAAVDEDAADVPLLAALAKSFCTEAGARAAATCLQVFGGVGFTWEHPAHLYLKRLQANTLLLGRPADHRVRLAGFLDLSGAVEDAGAA